MVALHELTAEQRRLQEILEDGADEQIESALAELNEALEHKALGIVYVRRNMAADAAAYKAESKRLAEKAKRMEARGDQLDAYVLAVMTANGVTEIKGPLVRLAVQECPPACHITDEADVPDEWRKPLPPQPTRGEPDKTRITAAFTKCGEVVPGTDVRRGKRLAIK